MIPKPLYHKAETIEELLANFTHIEKRIQLACQRSSRKVDSVRLLPVTKTVDEKVMRMAFKLGFNYFGENKVKIYCKPKI